MQWVNGLTLEEKIKRKSQWHRWFAWFPVTIGITNWRKIMKWLEVVERKGTYTSGYCEPNYWVFEYRKINE